MHALELLVPPPVVTLVTALLMWLISAFWPGYALPGAGGLLVPALVAGAGLACGVAGLHAFRRARTTMDPRTPGAASALVTSGIYRITRNPMYLGLQLVLIAWGIYLGHALSLLCAFVFALYIHRFQIRPEERFLQDKFGAAFESYKARVRAWI